MGIFDVLLTLSSLLRDMYILEPFLFCANAKDFVVCVSSP